METSTIVGTIITDNSLPKVDHESWEMLCEETADEGEARAFLCFIDEYLATGSWTIAAVVEDKMRELRDLYQGRSVSAQQFVKLTVEDEVEAAEQYLFPNQGELKSLIRDTLLKHMDWTKLAKEWDMSRFAFYNTDHNTCHIFWVAE